MTKQFADHHIKLRIFPTEWKIANVVPIDERDNKQDVKNY